jgi:2-oxoglutarate dehydrogenase complex dehydrogenase (E1) component-like enzyme
VVGNNVTRVIFTSGKQYYNLIEQRNVLDRKDVAIVRLESLCPFPTLELNKEMEKYPKAKCKLYSVLRKKLRKIIVV